jgi:hypothetical protein
MSDIFDIQMPFVTQEQKYDYWVASKKEIKLLREIVEDQLRIIKGFTLECETMGTTDIITALSRKDECIKELEEIVSVLVTQINQ